VLGIESSMEGEALSSVAFQTDTASSFVSELGERILQTSLALCPGLPLRIFSLNFPVILKPTSCLSLASSIYKP